MTTELTELEQQVIAAIKASGKNLSALAEECGVHRVGLSKFVNGKAGLTSGSLGRLVAVLGFRLVQGSPPAPVPKYPVLKPYAEMTPFELLEELGYDLATMPEDFKQLDPEDLLAQMGIDPDDPHGVLDLDPDDETSMEPDTFPDGEDPYRPPKGANGVRWFTDRKYRREFRSGGR